MNLKDMGWADALWNPLTGCREKCVECGARECANRLGRRITERDTQRELHILREPISENSYPYQFEPTFHIYRMGHPKRYRNGRIVRVGTMGDMFGDWVPEWIIREILEDCLDAPQHRYLFMTRNPRRYAELAANGILPDGENFWYGTKIRNTGEKWFTGGKRYQTYLYMDTSSPEEMADIDLSMIGWVIIDAKQTGETEKPQREARWIRKMIRNTVMSDVPLYCESGISRIMGERLIREFPWKNPKNQ